MISMKSEVKKAALLVVRCEIYDTYSGTERAIRSERWQKFNKVLHKRRAEDVQFDKIFTCQSTRWEKESSRGKKCETLICAPATRLCGLGDRNDFFKNFPISFHARKYPEKNARPVISS